MKVAIMQPYFFPYLGYFSLINMAEQFIIFDTPQFMRKGWIERNRIIKLSGGSAYIKVPLKKAELNTSIKDMLIDDTTDWRKKILSQLDIYKKKSPYFMQVKLLVEKCLNDEYIDIVSLNKRILTVICNYLGIDTEIKVYSEMNIDIDTPNAPDEWALNICKEIGATTYINAVGGQDFFVPQKYKCNNVNLFFVEQPLTPYNQIRIDHEFESGLSILDIMMFNSPEEIKAMLSEATLKSA